ncbi:MAG: hemolysin III family protein [Burkholderiaceae bacterium]
MRAQSLGEEIANAISHGAGLLLAVASLPVLVLHAAQRGGAADIVGVSLLASTMIVLYLVSALYHALPRGRAKHWFNRLDHAVIYVFIAGSYMPYLLGVLRGAWGWTLVFVDTALIGVVAKLG